MWGVQPVLGLGGPLVLLLTGWGCSGGGGGGGGSTSFQVDGLSLTEGAVWQINREIVLTFTEPVDFTTVSSNTINIRSDADVPATGTFSLRDPHTVVFQPNCPTLDDLSDAGLQPNGVNYVLRVAGRNSSSNTLVSVNGVPLGLQQVRHFSTPASTQISVAFQDTTPGPPAPVLREQGSTELSATYMEIGGDPDARVYFELDANHQLVLSDPSFEVPLNLYSDPSTHVAVVIAFNQPVNPSSSNISESRLRLEYRDAQGAWHALKTRVTLVGNCSGTGARVRLDPIGLLPASSEFRAVVRAGFQDLVGESNLQSATSFAQAPTRAVDFTSLTPSDRLSDEINEGFELSGDSPLSFEDETAVLDTPQADWGEGRLSAAFSFDGTGGPSGDFDWVVRSGEKIFFDTTSTPVVGGPNGVPTTTVTFLNGVVDVRNLVIQEGAEIRVQGPHPLRINATGEVRIEGLLDLSGFNGRDVFTLNTTHLMELGGVGAAGGGRGGHANENTSAPTLRGGRGSGPFGQLGQGAEGGEMGISDAPGQNGKDQRRPGGGGGGRFARDWVGTDTPQGWSLAASAGHDGHPLSRGAESGVMPSRGGRPGVGPFIDSSDANDFYGVRPVVEDGAVVGLVRGELTGVWAGHGGGGGGNASRVYPQVVWSSIGDEKGGGGGGAAGGLHVKALGRIVFAGDGAIVARGATGGTGEPTFLDHIGGTGGAGSGGHVILESASSVDFTDGGASPTDLLVDRIDAAAPAVKTGWLGQVHDCCRTYSNGGAGSGGVIQLHVPDPVSAPSHDPLRTDIVVPLSTTGLANPLDAVTSPPPYVLVPTFGARSRGRSKWISIGGADERPDGSQAPVRFLFAGIETAPGPDEGKLLRVDGSAAVADVEPLLWIPDLTGSSVARVLSDGYTLELIGAALLEVRSGTTSGVSNDVYLRTPALLRDCALRLGVLETPTNVLDYDVARAEYDEGAPGPGDEALRITVTAERGRLTDFNPHGTQGTTTLRLQPRFFRVVTGGLSNHLPTTAYVRVRFQGAADNGAGRPDESNPLVDWTADVARFNALVPGALQYFRYEVEFDLDAEAQGVTQDTIPVTLDFLKLPFVF